MNPKLNLNQVVVQFHEPQVWETGNDARSSGATPITQVATWIIKVEI